MFRLEPSNIFYSGCTRFSCEFGIEKESACIRVRARLASRNAYDVEGIEGDFRKKGIRNALSRVLPGGMTLPLVRIVNLEFVQTPEREMKSFSVEPPNFLLVYVCMIF